MSKRHKPGKAVTCFVLFLAMVLICTGLVYIGLGLGGRT